MSCIYFCKFSIRLKRCRSRSNEKSNRHCCWGTCTSDSRRRDNLPEGVKFLPFPKPGKIKNGMTELEKDQARKRTEKTKRWIYLCGRKNFTSIDQVSRNTHICTLHFDSLSGPNDDNPEPFMAGLTEKEKESKSRVVKINNYISTQER